MELKLKYFIYIFLAAGIIVYLGYKAVNEANEPNTYFYAAQQLLHHENIYSGNPYNQYLYSPLFALIMVPFSLLPWLVGRIIWMFVNLIVTIRLWIILKKMPESIPGMSQRFKTGGPCLCLSFLWAFLTIILYWVN